MAPFFKPLSRWFSRLTYSQKFSVITLIFVVPVIAFTPFIAGQIERIDKYGNKEKAGAIYVRALWTLSENVKSFTTIAYDAIYGNTPLSTVLNAQEAVEADLEILDTIHTKYQEDLALGEEPVIIREQWANTKNALRENNLESFRKNQVLLFQSISNLSLKVGDSSYLILDPDLDTYYLMDTVLLKLPENQDLTFAIWLIIEEAVNRGELSVEDQVQLSILAGRLEVNFETMDRNLGVAIQNDATASIADFINEPLRTYQKDLLAFTEIVRFDTSNPSINQNSINALGLVAKAQYEKIQDSDSRLYNATSARLENGIRNRTNSLTNQLYLFSAIALASILGAVLIGNSVMRSIREPLHQLIVATRALSSGEMSTRVDILAEGEIRQVAVAFNQMASDLEQDKRALAMRSEELNQALAQSQKRTQDLQIISSISKIVSSEQRLDNLMPLIAQTISGNLDFYHVGIFLLDTAQEYAVLSAANSTGGQKMLERSHRLRVGETGIVGYVTSTGKPRIALDTGTDAVFFNNPDLPETRSEIALPLRVGEQIIGALDVQSTESNAFNQEDVNILSTLADQVSIAIQNARQFEETRRALAESNSLSKQFIQTGWSRFTRTNKLEGIRHTGAKSTLLYKKSGKGKDESDSDKNQLKAQGRGAVLSLPIKLRGEVIGSVDVRSPENRRWDQDELDIVTAIIERSAIAMENARLLADSQKLAAKERTIGEISARISAQSEVGELLKTATQELGRTLPGMEISVQLRREEAE